MNDEMQIPDSTVWGTLTFMGAVVAWLVRLEARLNARLTRKEHSEICDRSNAELTLKLEKIQLTLEKQNDSSVMHRQFVGDSLATIRTQIAVIRTKMGDDPLEDTGMFKRVQR